jgi:hypothetical protein
VKAGLALALALHELHATAWDIEHLDRMLQSRPALDALEAGKSIDVIAATWASPLASFAKKRERFLLY